MPVECKCYSRAKGAKFLQIWSARSVICNLTACVVVGMNVDAIELHLQL